MIIHETGNPERTFASFYEANLAWGYKQVKGITITVPERKVSYDLSDVDGELFYAPTYVSLDKATLKLILTGLLSGQMLSSTQVPPDLLGSVFMPLAFGCMAMPEEIMACLAGVEPVKPTLPPAPVKTEYTEPKPVLPKEPEYEEIPQDLLRKHEYGYLLTSDFEAATADLLERNAQAKAKWLQENEAAIIATQRWQHAALVHDLKYQEEFDAWSEIRLDIRSFDKDLAAWKAHVKRVQDKFAKIRVASLGAVVGDLGNTFARSINGFPIFHTITIINASDWARIVTAYEKEVSRMAEMDI